MKKSDKEGNKKFLAGSGESKPSVEEIVDNCRREEHKVCVIYQRHKAAISSRLLESMQDMSSYLRRLYLTEDNLSSLPPEIGCLYFLEELYLRGNKLNKLPKEIGCLRELVRLDLKDNMLESLPVTIRNLNKLTLLRLQNNNIKWLPPELGYLTSLKKMNLRNNKLEWLPLSLKRNQPRVKLDEGQLEKMEETINAIESHQVSYHESYKAGQVIESLADLCCNVLLEMYYNTTTANNNNNSNNSNSNSNNKTENSTESNNNNSNSNNSNSIFKMLWHKSKKGLDDPFSLEELELPDVIMPRFQGKIVRRRCERCKKTFVGGIQKFSSGKLGGTNVVFFTAYCTLACYRGKRRRRRPPPMIPFAMRNQKINLAGSYDALTTPRMESSNNNNNSKNSNNKESNNNNTFLSTAEKRKLLLKIGSDNSLRSVKPASTGSVELVSTKKKKEKKAKKKRTQKQKGSKEKTTRQRAQTSVEGGSYEKNEKKRQVAKFADKLKDALSAVSKPKYKEL